MGDQKEETHCEKCCEALDNPDNGICPSCEAAIESERDGDADDQWEDTEEERQTGEPASAEGGTATDDGQEDGEGRAKAQVSPS